MHRDHGAMPVRADIDQARAAVSNEACVDELICEESLRHDVDRIAGGIGKRGREGDGPLDFDGANGRAVSAGAEFDRLRLRSVLAIGSRPYERHDKTAWWRRADASRDSRR